MFTGKGPHVEVFWVSGASWLPLSWRAACGRRPGSPLGDVMPGADSRLGGLLGARSVSSWVSEGRGGRLLHSACPNCVLCPVSCRDFEHVGDRPQQTGPGEESLEKGPPVCKEGFISVRSRGVVSPGGTREPHHVCSVTHSVQGALGSLRAVVRAGGMRCRGVDVPVWLFSLRALWLSQQKTPMAR